MKNKSSYINRYRTPEITRIPNISLCILNKFTTFVLILSPPKVYIIPRT